MKDDDATLSAEKKVIEVIDENKISVVEKETKENSKSVEEEHDNNEFQNNTKTKNVENKTKSVVEEHIHQRTTS